MERLQQQIHSIVDQPESEVVVGALQLGEMERQPPAGGGVVLGRVRLFQADAQNGFVNLREGFLAEGYRGRAVDVGDWDPDFGLDGADWVARV